MLNVGIIGCGKIAQIRHIPEYLNNKNVKITSFFDLNKERAQALAEKYQGKAFDSLDDMLKDPELDAVSICSANTVHAEHALKALENHKHVLLEKPMATKLEDCIKIVDLAKKNNLKLMIDQNQRLAKAHAKAKELIEKGEIGKIISFRTTFGHGGPETWSIDPGINSWFFDKNRSAMGALGDLGVHKTDLISYLVGSRIKAVTAKIATIDKKDASGNPVSVDDNAFCIYEMENGVIGTMTASWTFYGREDNSTIIYGQKGILRIYDSKDYSIELLGADGSVVNYDLDRIQTNDNQTSTGIIDAFVDCIKNNHKPLIDGESVLGAMKAVFAAMESSEIGRRIEIKE